MSKVQLQGNASGTGIFTIASPNSNTDRTLTLPDSTGTLLNNSSNSNFPAGSVIQVQSFTFSGSYSTNATSLTATGLTVTITPKSSSSKILVMYDINFTHKNGGAPISMTQYFSLYRQINGGGYSQLKYGGSQGNMSNGSNGGDVFGGTMSLSYLDSPATTTAVNYQLYMSGDNSSYLVYFGEASSACTITAIEVAA